MVPRPTLGQLHVFVQQVLTLARRPAPADKLAALLSTSASFLSQLMPPRLRAHHRGHHPRALAELPSFSALAQCVGRYSRDDLWLAAAGSGAFATFTDAAVSDMEAAVRTVAHELRDQLERCDLTSERQQQRQREVNALLDASYSMLIEMRVLASHFQFGHAVLQAAQGGGEAAEAIARSHPIVRPIDLVQLGGQCAETARAAAIEKFGDAPAITVGSLSQGDREQKNATVTMLGCASHIHFLLLELLKNAIKSTIERHGVLQLHEASPIAITVSDSGGRGHGRHVGLIVSDSGVGLSSLSLPHKCSPTPASLFDYFATTSPRPTESDDWRYSRSFGSPFSGLGVGLNMSRLHAETLYGGSLNVSWVPGLTQACVVLDGTGSAPIGRDLLLLNSDAIKR